jgi:LysM domain
MRRNETVLVYAVTGVLVVILAIAVIFGEESAQVPKTRDSARAGGKGLLDVLGEDLPITPVDPRAVDPRTVDPRTVDPKLMPPGPSNTHKTDNLGKGQKGENAGPVDADHDMGTGGDAVPAVHTKPDDKTPDDRKTDAVAPVPLVTPTIAEQVTRVLGASQREGSYRVVTARGDDRLSTLVERWCGNLDALPVVEALNEDLKPSQPIPAGRKVLVPWTDDEVLLVAQKERKKKIVQIERTKGELYILKKGDSLWRIAVGRVGSRQAPAYIQAIVKSNPQLEDPNAVREGQKIRLPPPETLRKPEKLPPAKTKG